MENIVTVIIPSYKRAHLLSQTIPSYLQEGVKELILVDDCSPDNTADVVRDLQKLYPQIKYIRQPQNRKQAAAKNRALEEVSTEWVYFGDDDSVLYPDSIKTLYDTCVQYNAEICGAAAYYMSPGHERLTIEEYLKKVRKYVESPQQILDLENLKARFDLSYKEPIEVPFCQACLLMKSQLAQSVKFDPLYLGNAYREETDFIVRCAAEGAKVMYNSDAAQINLPPIMATGGAHIKTAWGYRKDVISNTWRFLRINYPFLQKKYHLKKSMCRMQLECIWREVKSHIKSTKRKKKITMLATPIYVDIPSFLPSHPWHPSVVYVSDGWNGHRWWMAETPFPPFNVSPYKDRWELPCIHHSDDGIHWKSIDENPIDDISKEQIKSYDYLSDPHLILVNDVLYCYYRLMSDWDKQTTIYLKRSKDGCHWSDRELVCSVASAEREIVSPAIVWEDDRFRMYYVDDTYTNLNRGIQVCESKDGVRFDEPRQVTYPKTYQSNPIIPWHIDVQRIGEKLYMVIYDQEQECLFLLQSIDGIHFETPQKLLHVSKKWGCFYNQKLYRACYVQADQVSRLYFSATNGESSHIGVMELRPNSDWQVVDCRKRMEHIVFIVTMLWQDVYHAYKKIRHIVAQNLKE